MNSSLVNSRPTMEVAQAAIPFGYTTIVVTKSRIDKGLLAIPVSLMGQFPKTSGYIYLLEEDGHWSRKSFTAYDSTSKECRIGGLRDFYHKYAVKSGDELVLHVYGDDRFEIVPEALFRHRIQNGEARLDDALSQAEADSAINDLSKLTHTPASSVAASEFIRLAGLEPLHRQVAIRPRVNARESIAPSLRRILLDLYHGRCQVSGFTFMTRSDDPYFEVHHIDPILGNHPKNVLVVSPNVHAQFTYARVEQTFDDFGWLRQVMFNGDAHTVFQIVDQLPRMHQKQVHSV